MSECLCVFVPKVCFGRLTDTELRAALEESKFEEKPFVASNEDEYISEPADIEYEKSDVEKEPAIEQEEEYDSDESDEEEPEPTQSAVGKDGTQWRDTPYPQAQTVSRNVMPQKGGATAFSALFTAKETFKSIMSNKIYDIILKETYRKGRKVAKDYNIKLVQKYKAFKRPPPKIFKPFTEEELDAFLGIPLAACVHKSNKEHISEMIRSTDRRQKFLKDLAKRLCMPAIETRSAISKVIGNPYTRISMKMVLGRQIIQPVVTIARDQPSRDASGRISVVGSCTIGLQLNQRQRKTSPFVTNTLHSRKQEVCKDKQEM
ncbi:hypothetical protein ILUMI_16118 [Ignelater luminosus]|uniref:Uncharacterized protein n=1 Tax=Ignelater luminosus TaxID=2038154 RepID=A0A8K0G371_IGNLU|nr:hypothetical protein ILUMI_16118 [Ignelater luminosus]